MTIAASTPRMRTVFHVDLSDAPSEHVYRLHAHGDTVALTAHTDETRARIRSKSALLRDVPEEQLTHFSEEVEMPADQVVRVHLERIALDAGGGEAAVIGHVAMHIPPSDDELARLESGGDPHEVPINWLSTARSLLMHHPDLMSKDKDVARIIDAHMNNEAIKDQIEDLAEEMRDMGLPALDSGWARLVPIRPDLEGERTPYSQYDGTKTYYSTQPTQEIIEFAGPVMTALMLATKNDLELAGTKWEQQDGTSVESHDGKEMLALAAELELSGEKFTPRLANNGYVSGFSVFVRQEAAGSKRMTLSMQNRFIRYLGVYIRFYDALGNAIKGWNDHDNTVAKAIANAVDIQYDDLRFIGHIQPVLTVASIPVWAQPGRLSVTITFPADAVHAEIWGSGIGTGNNSHPKTPVFGGILTGLVNLAIPAFLMGFAVAQQRSDGLSRVVERITTNPATVKFLIGAAVGWFGSQFAVTGVSEHRVSFHALVSLSGLIFNKALSTLLIFIEGVLALAAVANAIPFSGWIMAALNISLGLSEITQTIVGVATSRWNIDHQMATTITTNITVSPDPRSPDQFPAPRPNLDSMCVIKMIYKGEERPTVSQTHTIEPGSVQNTIPAAFPDNTLGGQVKFEADYFVGTWLAARATTGWLPNDDRNAGDVRMFLVNYPLQLTGESVYIHSQLLGFKDGRYGWMPEQNAPTATITSRNTASEGNAISEWSGITLSQRLGLLGFAWKAAGTGVVSCASRQGGQLHVMQTMSVPGRPTETLFPQCGFDGPTQLIFDPFPPKFQMEDGKWVMGTDGRPLADPSDQVLGNYYIDPRKAGDDHVEGGGFHLREIRPQRNGELDLRSTLSFARFPLFPDSFALHPSRHVIAVNTMNSKLQITSLMSQGQTDRMVPLARVYSGQAFNRDRRGLLFHPVAVACAYDGTILILEDSKFDQGGQQIISRIQAFDLFGDPVPRFYDAAGNKTPFLQLSQGAGFNYLDMAVTGGEKMTYIFVLYYTGNGAKPADYHMAVYQYGVEKPAENPLVTTDGISAARLTADMWNSVYTLNWASVTDEQGKPARRTVPSVSQWVPPVPA